MSEAPPPLLPPPAPPPPPPNPPSARPTFTCSTLPGVTLSMPVTSAPLPPGPLIEPPAPPYRVNVAWVTPAGTVQYCGPLVELQVTVAVAPLITGAWQAGITLAAAWTGPAAIRAPAPPASTHAVPAPASFRPIAQVPVIFIVTPGTAAAATYRPRPDGANAASPAASLQGEPSPTTTPATARRARPGTEAR